MSAEYFKVDDTQIDRYISEYHAGYVIGQLAREVKELRALASRSPAIQQGEPAHLAFRRKAFELAMTMNPADFAGDLAAVDTNTIDGLARTLAIVAGGYEWDVTNDTGQLAAVVAGDQGYATTGIVLATTSPPDAPVLAVTDEAEQARVRISHALYGEGNDLGHPLHAVTDALIAIAETAISKRLTAAINGRETL